MPLICFCVIVAAKDRHHHGAGEDGPSARDLESKRRLENMLNKDEKDIEEYYRYAESWIFFVVFFNCLQFSWFWFVETNTRRRRPVIVH